MSNVSLLRPADNPDVVLEEAKGNYGNIFIIGFDKEGELDVRSDTKTTQEQVIWMLDKFKHKLMNGDYNQE